MLDGKVHIKHSNVVNVCFIHDSLLEMPIGIDILKSEESPYFAHTAVQSYGQEMSILKVTSENVAKVHKW